MQEGVDEDDLDAVSLQEKLANVGMVNDADESDVKAQAKVAVDNSYGARIKQAMDALGVLPVSASR